MSENALACKGQLGRYFTPQVSYRFLTADIFQLVLSCGAFVFLVEGRVGSVKW